MRTKTLISKLGRMFPKSIAKENHDYVGLMCGTLKEETHKILLCLDFDNIALKEMKKEDLHPDLIISHHPFIYGTRKYVLEHDPMKKEVYNELISLGIPVYSMHTNFDTGAKGMNDALMEELGLENIHPDASNPMMRVGTLPAPMEVREFSKYVKEKLDLTYALLIDKGNKIVSKVSLIAGGGSYKWEEAKANGSDIYISGDAPHHVRRDIVTNSFNYLDLPHEIERIFMTQMKKILLEMDPTFEIYIIDHEGLPTLI
ncbi:MAG: Nif3-like dinuclear metal center hexameric protein [Coprobacillus sp.]|nr:Nif3-like dinuclear metal center hexameric protein [Coprobacillus sp.]